MIDFQVGVVLPAAGSGQRFGSATPKQYCKILDKPLFLHALEAFQRISFVSKIALVVDDPKNVVALLQESNCHNVLVVRGERTRHRSIRAGLRALTKEESNLRIILVHDAARPIVPDGLVKQLVEAADKNGAAGSICPLVSTVLATEGDGTLKSALNRQSHVASETPQAFQTNILLKSYNKCTEEDLDSGTECLQLALVYGGVHARLIEGSPNDLWKVTLPRDLHTASACLREHLNSICIISNESSKTAQLLFETLTKYVQRIESVFLNQQEGVGHLLGQHYNNIIFLHERQTDIESSVSNFISLLDLESLGLIVHIMDQKCGENLQDISVSDFSSSGRQMAQRYKKLKKGVVVINCLDCDTDFNSLKLILTSLFEVHPFSFTGQTLYL